MKDNWKPIEDDNYYMDDLDWFGDDPLPKPKKFNPRYEKSHRESAEYIEGGILNMKFPAITYDDQIDFHNWLRDTPTEYILVKLGDKK